MKPVSVIAIGLVCLVAASRLPAMDTFGLYQVNLLGDNYLINMNGQTRKLGFVTTRVVQAETLADAERLALRLVKLELRGKVLNRADDPPRLAVEDSVRIEPVVDDPRATGLRFVWFPLPVRG